MSSQTVAGMLRRFQALNPTEILGEAIQEKEREAVELQQAQLFLKGEKADGTKLAPYKSPAYARRKNRMNPAPGLGQPDAYNTGEMYREMFVDVQGEKAVFDSASQHATFMIQRDGPAVFGLQDDSKKQHAAIIQPVVVQKIREATGCK